MKKTILVTGVTRMYHGFVCVSGIDVQSGAFVRPEIPCSSRPGIKQQYLYNNGQAVIRPLTKVSIQVYSSLRPSACSAPKQLAEKCHRRLAAEAIAREFQVWK